MIGYAICGSFCTHDQALEILRFFTEQGIDVQPVLSHNAYTISTRFGKAPEFVKKVESITGRKVFHTIEESEAIGPDDLLDALIIAPCTGNTLAKLAHGITDTAVTMAAKATLRNSKPLIIGLCTNDALSANAPNLGAMLGKKNVYFVPFYQDDIKKKPASAVCDMSLVYKTYELARGGAQIQPLVF